MATTPDIVIGDHPTLGVVANNHSNLPAAKQLLNRLGFERITDKGLYTLTASNQPAADRAAQAVAILRAARFDVETDLAFEPEPGTLRPAPIPRRAQAAPAEGEPDVAFGKHPTQGIVAAVSDDRPYARMVLRVAGFRYDPDLDVYTLPAGTDHATASDIVRHASQVMAATGSVVHVVPGTLSTEQSAAAPESASVNNTTTQEPSVTDESPEPVAELDGPAGARALLEAVRRLIQAAAAWCTTRAATAGAHLADRFTDAAQALGRVEASLDQASERLQTDRPNAMTTTASAQKPATDRGLVASLAPEAGAAEIGTALDRVTDDVGALTAVHELVEQAARQCADLPGEMGVELSVQLREAGRALDRVGGALIDVSDHLADMPQPSAVTTTTARAAATRSTRSTRSTAKTPAPPTGRTPVAAHPAWTAPTPGRRTR
ncbi:hypothetical protein [Embleya sp. NPDC059259]|uniref:hypothetical protein n=1 Tax=unclassified Embleya TaxID=2699296 RepID=UPI0036A4F723